MTLLVILLIIAVVWIVSLYYKIEQVKTYLKKIPEAAKKIDNKTDALATEVFILRRTLLNVVKGVNETVNKMAKAKNKKELDNFKKVYDENSIAEQAASIYLANIKNTGHTTELLKKIYRDHDLPEQYSSDLAMIEYEAINGKQGDQKSWHANYDKYEKMLKRGLKTDFENMHDELEAELKQELELIRQSSEYY